MSDHAHDPLDRSYTDHCVLLENHDTRITGIEDDMSKLEGILQQQGEIVRNLNIALTSMTSSFHTLRPIVYAMLGVSLISFLGMVFNFFIKVGQRGGM